MATKIFISYRRDDSAGHAGRLHDRLEREFGSDLLFMDVDAIPLGVNFMRVLREEVAKCDALLAVIGPNWLNVRDEDGGRRLDNPNDFVRIEIATALQRDIPVIPILLDGARIPKSDLLPGDLAELTQRNALDVRHASFHIDMDKLIRGLRRPSSRVGARPQAASGEGPNDAAAEARPVADSNQHPGKVANRGPGRGHDKRDPERMSAPGGKWETRLAAEGGGQQLGAEITLSASQEPTSPVIERSSKIKHLLVVVILAAIVFAIEAMTIFGR